MENPAKIIQSILNGHIEMMSQDLEAINRGEMFFTPKKIPEENLEILCEKVTQVFMRDETLIDLEPPLTIIGDLHGQIFDLYQIFRHFDLPPARKYLFLGDLVDRGSFSIEIVSLIFALKVLYPNYVYIIRGNHEFENISLQGGFFTEIVEQYGSSNLFRTFITTFGYLPIAAKIGKILCVHAGLGPEFRSISQIKELTRPISSYDTSLLTGILWSDPSKEPTNFCASRRGTGFYFNQPPLQIFLENNNLTTLVRGHECVSGVKMIWNNSLITVFSASNYCGLGNKAGVLFINENYEMKALSFGPYRLIQRNDGIDSLMNPMKKIAQSPSSLQIRTPKLPMRNRSATCYIPSQNSIRMSKMQKISRINAVIPQSKSVHSLPK